MTDLEFDKSIPSTESPEVSNNTTKNSARLMNSQTPRKNERLRIPEIGKMKDLPPIDSIFDLKAICPNLDEIISEIKTIEAEKHEFVHKGQFAAAHDLQENLDDIRNRTSEMAKSLIQQRSMEYLQWMVDAQEKQFKEWIFSWQEYMSNYEAASCSATESLRIKHKKLYQQFQASESRSLEEAQSNLRLSRPLIDVQGRERAYARMGDYDSAKVFQEAYGMMVQCEKNAVGNSRIVKAFHDDKRILHKQEMELSALMKRIERDRQIQERKRSSDELALTQRHDRSRAILQKRIRKLTDMTMTKVASLLAPVAHRSNMTHQHRDLLDKTKDNLDSDVELRTVPFGAITRGMKHLHKNINTHKENVNQRGGNHQNVNDIYDTSYSHYPPASNPYMNSARQGKRPSTTSVTGTGIMFNEIHHSPMPVNGKDFSNLNYTESFMGGVSDVYSRSSSRILKQLSLRTSQHDHRLSTTNKKLHRQVTFRSSIDYKYLSQTLPSRSASLLVPQQISALNLLSNENRSNEQWIDI